MDKKIPKEVTLKCLESVIEGTGEFKQWADFSDVEIMEIEGFIPDIKEKEYKVQLLARMNDRLEFLKSRENVKGGFDKFAKKEGN